MPSTAEQSSSSQQSTTESGSGRRTLWPIFDHADRAIYILISLVAVLVVQEQAGASVAEAVAGATATVLALTLAELFARQLGIRVREERPLTRHDWEEGLMAALVGLIAAAGPLAVLIAAGLDAYEVDTAYDIAQWTGVAVIFGYALLVGRKASMPWKRAVLVAIGFALIGVALIFVKSAIK